MKRFLTLSVLFVALGLFCGAAHAQPQYWPAEFESTCPGEQPYNQLPAQGYLPLTELTLTPVSIPNAVGSTGYSGWIWSEGDELVLSVTGVRAVNGSSAGNFSPFELRLTWDADAHAWLTTRPVAGSVVEVWAVKLNAGCGPVLFTGYLSAVPGKGFSWYSWRQVYGDNANTAAPRRTQRRPHE